MSEKEKGHYRLLIAPPNSPMDSMDSMDSMDFSEFRAALPSCSSSSSSRSSFTYPTHLCNHCSLRYLPMWYDYNHHRCFFCMRFRSPNITRYALLYETQWFFIQSGEDDPIAYYDTYFTLLHRWADQKQIPFTKRDADYQFYLLAMLDQTNPTH